MWEIFGEVFFNDSQRLVDVPNKIFRQADIEALLTEKGIAIFDTACAVRRLSGNASDKDLEIVEKTDIAALLRQIPLCRNLVCTGQKSFLGIDRRLRRRGPQDGRIQRVHPRRKSHTLVAHALVVTRVPHAAQGESGVLPPHDAGGVGIALIFFLPITDFFVFLHFGSYIQRGNEEII